MGDIGPARQRYEVLPVEPLRTSDLELDDVQPWSRNADAPARDSSAGVPAHDADRPGDEPHPS